jgi:hypothetical protein
MTVTATVDRRDIAITVFSKTAYKIYDIRFANEALALRWLEAHKWEMNGTRSDTYATGEATELADKGVTRPIDPERDPILFERFYPVCEHGMDGNRCMGPSHFCSDEEIAQGW